MKIRSMITGIVLSILSPLYAGPILQLGGASMQINQCAILITANPLDLAINGAGYLVVSQGKNKEQLYTRYGRMRLDVDGYIVNELDQYLLKINKKSEFNRLSKIKIPTKNLAPKATKAVAMEANLPANATKDDIYRMNLRIYDSLAGEHVLNTKFSKIADNTWQVRVFLESVYLGAGKIVFNNQGILIKQEGLARIHWPTNYGMHELKIDLKHSTQYASEFQLMSLRQDGYGLGSLTGLEVNRNGEIQLLYTNGQIKTLNGRIALAKFTNPSYLEFVIDHLYRPSEQSGSPMIHWVNGEYSVISGALEQEPCLKA